MFNLSGKRALVTGASRGAGRGIAKALADAGATVVIAARNVKALETLRHEIEAAEGKAEIQAADLSTPAGCRDLAQRSGPVDILINNAALTSAKFQSIVVPDDDYWNLSIQLNLMAPLFLIQGLCPGMAKRGGGVVVNISSIAAQRGTPQHAPYSASKAALEAMSKVAAMDMARDRIRVVVVALGLTDTEALAEACAEGATTAELANIMVPTGRLTRVDEVANLCRYLASDEAAAITGTVITIDNGLTAGQSSFTGKFGLGVQFS